MSRRRVRSWACHAIGFYRYKSAVENGGVEALFERTRRRPNLTNRVDQATEGAVITSATDFPAYGQVRISNGLRKLGVVVPPSAVGSIWLRHDLAAARSGILQGPPQGTGGQGCRGRHNPDRSGYPILRPDR